MKRQAGNKATDDPLDEYEFRGGVRGKYARRYADAPDVAVVDRRGVRKPLAWDLFADALRRGAPLAPGLSSELHIGQLGGAAGCLVKPSVGIMAQGARPGCEAEIAGTIRLTFGGFASGQPICLDLRRPDGRSAEVSVPPSEEGQHAWDWTPWPGDPTGPYTVVAKQGATEASGTILVRSPAQPRLSVVPRSGPPGASFKIALAGYEPGALVPLRVYRCIGAHPSVLNAEGDYQGEMTSYVYLASLRPVRVDERGEAAYELSTAPHDPEGQYVIETGPPAQKGGAFFTRVFSLTADADGPPAVRDRLT